MTKNGMIPYLLETNNMATIRYYPPERRRYPRTQLRMMLHGIRLDPDGGDVQNTLEMVDISRGGMGVISDRWLYRGQKIALSIPAYGQKGRKTVFATVVRCQKTNEGYRAGLQFDPTAIAAALGDTSATALAA